MVYEWPDIVNPAQQRVLLMSRTHRIDEPEALEATASAEILEVVQTCTVLFSTPTVLKEWISSHKGLHYNQRLQTAHWNKKKACKLEFAHITSSLIWLMQSAKLHLFILHFLISPIYLWVSTLTNLGFLVNDGFWYVVLILDFTGLSVCSTFICVQNLSCI